MVLAWFAVGLFASAAGVLLHRHGGRTAKLMGRTLAAFGLTLGGIGLICTGMLLFGG